MDTSKVVANVGFRVHGEAQNESVMPRRHTIRPFVIDPG
jgi:hypothetical protein